MWTCKTEWVSEWMSSIVSVECFLYVNVWNGTFFLHLTTWLPYHAHTHMLSFIRVVFHLASVLIRLYHFKSISIHSFRVGFHVVIIPEFRMFFSPSKLSLRLEWECACWSADARLWVFHTAAHTRTTMWGKSIFREKGKSNIYVNADWVFMFNLSWVSTCTNEPTTTTTNEKTFRETRTRRSAQCLWDARKK